MSKSTSDPGNSDDLSDDEYPIIEEVKNFSIVQDQCLECCKDSDSDKARTPSPSKIKLPFFEGFRNTFRARARSEDVDCNNGDLVQALNVSRRWSETQTNNVDPVDGTIACVVSDWQAAEAGQVSLRRGERVRILQHSKETGFYVQKCKSSSTMGSLSTEKGWVPAHSLAFSGLTTCSNGTSKKPWSFRFRKPSFSSGSAGLLRRRVDRLSIESSESLDIPSGNRRDSSNSPSDSETALRIMCKLVDCSVGVGKSAQFKCQVLLPSHIDAQNVTTIWRKSVAMDDGLNSFNLEGGRYSVSFNDRGIASLTIADCQINDSGIYSCSLVASYQPKSSVTTSAQLFVIANSVGEPRAQALSPSSALLEWEGDSSAYYTILYQRCDPNLVPCSEEWVSATESSRPVLGLSYCIEGLTPGSTYVFKVSNSLPSAPLSLPTFPTSHEFISLRWQQEQFGRRYLEKEILGRGRFSVVKKAQDRGTGQLVAAKQVLRSRQDSEITHAEYTVLLKLEHQSIVRAFALFEASPQPDVDTIIMQLVTGPMLLAYVCQQEYVSEKTVRSYMNQLFSALEYLHDKRIGHYDIRPENLLVDLCGPQPFLKLVDFGGSVIYQHLKEITPPASLEFAAPECVLGQPAGPPCDIWSAAVFLYVFLSGLSPFLDESVEETTTNVLKCDFSFPDEYFGSVSAEAKLLISKMLVVQPSLRITAGSVVDTSWFQMDPDSWCTIPTSRLSLFVQRRQPQSQSLSSLG